MTIDLNVMTKQSRVSQGALWSYLHRLYCRSEGSISWIVYVCYTCEYETVFSQLISQLKSLYSFIKKSSCYIIHYTPFLLMTQTAFLKYNSSRKIIRIPLRRPCDHRRQFLRQGWSIFKLWSITFFFSH